MTPLEEAQFVGFIRVRRAAIAHERALTNPHREAFAGWVPWPDCEWPSGCSVGEAGRAQVLNDSKDCVMCAVALAVWMVKEAQEGVAAEVKGPDGVWCGAAATLRMLAECWRDRHPAAVHLDRLARMAEAGQL